MTERSLSKLLKESLAAVQSAQARAPAWQAWLRLQISDADGNPRGQRPYTPEAIQAFEDALTADPDNPFLAHHLAIAWHARAWDLDLAGDPDAPAAWQRALGHWRRVAASPAFWAAMRDKLKAIDPAADPAGLERARRGLLEDQLDVHVAFIRHYIECNLPDRARAHVEIIKAAPLPQAVKNRFTPRVFAVMTEGAAKAHANAEYPSALTSYERFLALFPAYLPALRAVAETCKEWVSGLSYKENWDDITTLSQRCRPPMQALAAHPALSSDPLAGAALEALAQEFALRGQDRGNALASAAGEDATVDVTERDRAHAAFELGIDWGRLALGCSPGGSVLRRVLAASLNNYTLSRCKEVIEVQQSEVDPRLASTALGNIFRQAVALMDEAILVDPDEALYRQNRQSYADSLAQVEAESLRRRLLF